MFMTRLRHRCKHIISPTCMCILIRSRGAETVLDTAADIPPAAQCRDQKPNSVNPSVPGV